MRSGRSLVVGGFFRPFINLIGKKFRAVDILSIYLIQQA